ncbi:MAG: anthranilate synthase component I family protein, partial [Bacteroidota bacterium]
SNPSRFKKQLLSWSKGDQTLSYLDSNQTGINYSGIDCMLAVGVEDELLIREAGKSSLDPFEQLKAFYQKYPSWLFGYFSYDLKNSIEHLSSQNFDGMVWPDLHFFCPKHVIKLQGRQVEIYSTDSAPDQLLKSILSVELGDESQFVSSQDFPKLKARMRKLDYLATVEKVRQHLHRGDLYELNLCQEFYAENCEVDPLALFNKLNQLSKAPFSAYYRLQHQYLLCASPERFLQKKGQQILSQPIKGTIKRGGNHRADEQLKKQLFNSKKDRSENVMIVDLVRNDLARTCLPGSVKVEELFGIYSFEQVHQMISTVSGTLDPKVHFVDAIRQAYPMGSMTGAPKIRSMELIEQYEQSKRGLYSGAVGYIDPEGNFDFNVVIRSLMYHSEKDYLSFQVGGAIVYDSVPEKEYEECLLKAKGILEALELKL